MLCVLRTVDANESWGMELALGLSMNVAVVAICWINGWRPVNSGSSIRWHDDVETNNNDELEQEDEPAILWNGGIETTVGLVVAVAVMVAVAVEIASETGRSGVSRY
ncbi:Hypothetical protein PHPALM_19931 [Phytophthora palmivora]|uniref:Uncharacterized protein n=1 Tax=Phytophthora palmivora TaxID=4796 RepID=A0A2P4XG46_9STRA|nr:Hypothetical protein PHPALM_19931 [Phytophthora palmivora]